MVTGATKLRRIAEFARDAGVTVRALHLYDQLDLLKPAALTDSGYRLYGETELARLEQILALRFVGFNLSQIKELLGGSTLPLTAALRMQREVIARQKRRLESALAAIDEAERTLSRDERADLWETLRTIIEVFKVQNDWEWTQKYYSQQARDKIEERRLQMSPEAIETAQRAWSALIAEVEEAASHGLDPSSDAAQALAGRWKDLLAQFTQGDAEVHRGLNQLWSDQTHWPSDFKRPWSDAADAFIKKTLNCKSSELL
jgi:DNA-binding transcriptional MerR regulator